MRYFVIILMVLTSFCSVADEIYVDYVKGRKNNPGTKDLPLPNFSYGQKKLKVGDTLYILPSDKPIRDSLLIDYLAGTPDKPIIIDGMNNIFLGSRPLKENEWEKVQEGIYCKEFKIQSAARIYFIHNDKAVFMGRATKGGTNPEFKTVESLQPGEWTIVDTDPANRSKVRIFKAYIRLGENESSLADGNWEEPYKMSAVRFNALCNQKNCGHSRCDEKCSHRHCENLIFRNIIAKHFSNDGFNLHGKCYNITFENIAAIECSDDGISAHEDITVNINNFVSINNSTGICHITKSDSKHKNIYIEGTRGVDFYPCDDTKMTLENVYINGNSRWGVRLGQTQNGSLFMKDCLFVNSNNKAAFIYDTKIKNQAKLTFDNVKHYGYRRAIDSEGIIKLDSDEEAKKVLAEKRAYFFGLFNGKLEEACGEKVSEE